jgi:radical SAM/Cys-rich protein
MTESLTTESLKPLPIFDAALSGCGAFPLRAAGIDTLQINVGKKCNQACGHCHVDAGPHRTEEMTRETAEAVIGVLRRHPQLVTLDITGGAPELNPSFRFLVREARALGRRVIDRCNLTVLSVPGQETLAAFLAENRVEVTASLPYYLADRTDAQRGQGVFGQSINGLRRLNDLGYGKPDTGLLLNLVYNPTGAFLPPPQADIESEYRRELAKRHDIVFNHLFTITNMPIARFRHFLERSGNYERYTGRLAAAFNPAAAESVMCRSLISVSYDGLLYDCDFNQMLEMPVEAGGPRHIRDFDYEQLSARRITTGDHCLGCTAGAGSSCGGATT